MHYKESLEKIVLPKEIDHTLVWFYFMLIQHLAHLERAVFGVVLASFTSY